MRALQPLLLAMMLLSLPAITVRGDAARPEDRLDQPNIVLIVIDTLRADHLGCYGYERSTSPHIDRLAAEGVLFEQAYSPASWTLPAFASLFTGHLSAVHGATHHQAAVPATLPTLAEKLQNRGYYNVAVVSNPLLNAKHGFGRGFDLYDDFSVFFEAELAQLAITSDQEGLHLGDVVTGDTVTEQTLHLLKQAATNEKPFFLFVHYFDPHDSYIPPSPYDRKFDPDYDGPMDGRGIPAIRDDPPEGRDLDHLIARYDGEIAYQDILVGRLLEALDEHSDPINTITILTSDHGEAWGEHAMLLHGNTAYREEVWVPMIWRWPGRFPEGHRVHGPVSMMDISATLREVLEFECLESIQTRSLLQALEGGQLPEAEVVSERAIGTGHHVALTLGSLRFHARFQQRPDEVGAQYESYRIDSDPWEQRDLYQDDPDRFAIQKQTLVQIWTSAQELRHRHQVDLAAEPVQLTDEERRRIERLGYIGTE